MATEDRAERAERCPDLGYCHGRGMAVGSEPCEPGACLRVRTSGPLSGVFPGDRWPEAVREQLDRVEAALAGSRLTEHRCVPVALGTDGWICGVCKQPVQAAEHVTVPLAALRALVETAGAMAKDMDRAWGGDSDAVEQITGLAAALGVDGL